MNNMKIIFVFLLLIYWSFMISAPVVSKEIKSGGSRVIGLLQEGSGQEKMNDS